MFYDDISEGSDDGIDLDNGADGRKRGERKERKERKRGGN